jgi:hypothetical protein
MNEPRTRLDIAVAAVTHNNLEYLLLEVYLELETKDLAVADYVYATSDAGLFA